MKEGTDVRYQRGILNGSEIMNNWVCVRLMEWNNVVNMLKLIKTDDHLFIHAECSADRHL